MPPYALRLACAARLARAALKEVEVRPRVMAVGQAPRALKDLYGGQASSEVAHSHGTIAGPRPKRRPPGFRRDRRGLSHSVDPHTTIYTWTLLSRSTLVAQRSTLCYHARGLQLRTRQSSEPWSEFEHKRSPRNTASEARYPGLRGGSMDDGSRDEWHSTLYISTSPRLSCCGDNAVEWRSTLLRIGNSRVPVHYLKTTSLHSTLYHSLPRSTA